MTKSAREPGRRLQKPFRFPGQTCWMRVLVVDDDPAVLDSLERALRIEGYAVDAVGAGFQALERQHDKPADAVVLDLRLPDLDGLEVCRRMRASGDATAVLMLTARDAVGERVAGLDAGADDYLVKPFGVSQIEARVRAVLRRAADEGRRSEPVLVGGLRLDGEAHEATLEGRPLDLSRREFDLLYYLAVRAGQVVTKRDLLTHVWRMPYGGADKTVDVHVSWLRRKLGESAQQPRYLHTIRGVGMKLSAPA
jgi:two-component system, OmpR family, KDP operon response regulator KdpE